MSTPAYSPVEPSERQEKPKKQPNVVQRYARMVYNPLGFKKVYNFIFWFIFAGALFGFCWWNIRSIDVKGHWIKDAPPGDDYYFRLPRYSLVSLPLDDQDFRRLRDQRNLSCRGEICC